MTDCLICNICNNPARFGDSSEVRRVPSNVRKFQTEKFTVWRCNSCNSLHSKEAIDLDLYYEHYPLKQHKLDFWARTAYNVRLKRLVREGLKSEHDILDYG